MTTVAPQYEQQCATGTKHSHSCTKHSSCCAMQTTSQADHSGNTYLICTTARVVFSTCKTHAQHEALLFAGSPLISMDLQPHQPCRLPAPLPLSQCAKPTTRPLRTPLQRTTAPKPHRRTDTQTGTGPQLHCSVVLVVCRAIAPSSSQAEHAVYSKREGLVLWSPD